MRGLCKEEDYAFLRTSERTEGAAALGNDWRDRKEERVWQVRPNQISHPKCAQISCISMCLCVCAVCVCMYVCLCDLGPQAIRAGAAGKKTTQRNRGEQEGEQTRAHTYTHDWMVHTLQVHTSAKQT